MNLLLIRHAETKQDPDSPSREWHLTERAYTACEDLAKRLRERNLSRIITSEEVKAKETGRVLAGHLGIPWSTAPNLHEHERTGVPYMEQEVWLERLESFFKHPDDLILGNEIGAQARQRFGSAGKRGSRASSERTSCHRHARFGDVAFCGALQRGECAFVLAKVEDA